MRQRRRLVEPASRLEVGLDSAPVGTGKEDGIVLDTEEPLYSEHGTDVLALVGVTPNGLSVGTPANSLEAELLDEIAQGRAGVVGQVIDLSGIAA